MKFESVNLRGPWRPDRDYALGDAVLHDGRAWIALDEIPARGTPPAHQTGNPWVQYIAAGRP